MTIEDDIQYYYKSVIVCMVCGHHYDLNTTFKVGVEKISRRSCSKCKRTTKQFVKNVKKLKRNSL